jgi:hypothetical protein
MEMKPPALPALALALLLAAAARADDAEDVRRLDREITVATWAGDPVWFEEHLAEEYVLVTPNGAIKTKRDVIRELSTPGLKMEPYEPHDVIVRLYGDAAVVTGRMIQRFTLGGIRYVNDLRYTAVYMKRKAKWLLVSGHTSLISPRR